MRIMDANFTNEMQKLLLETRERILRSLANESEQLRATMRNGCSGDLVDLATSGIDASLLESSGTRELGQLKMVEAALGRVNSNTYGQCVSCNEEIQEARLRAMPYTPFCMNCQRRIEQRKKSR